LRRYPFLCYFQGYHDICQVFLLVLEPAWRARLVARLSILRIRDFLLPNLVPTVSQLRLIPDILEAADPKLRQHVSGIQPFYALGGTLTMYAHDIQGYRDIVRLFDVLLVREPAFSIYMYAQIVLDRREELMDTPADDTSMLHFFLSKLPKRLDLEGLITRTKILFEKHPPEYLRSWHAISTHSCLKTARSLEACTKQSMEDGRECFEKYTERLRWLERRERLFKAMWYYGRPAQAIGLAIAIGVVAVYLRRNPATVNYLTSFLSRRA
jgi:TBC1 domain family member 20